MSNWIRANDRLINLDHVKSICYIASGQYETISSIYFFYSIGDGEGYYNCELDKQTALIKYKELIKLLSCFDLKKTYPE